VIDFQNNFTASQCSVAMSLRCDGIYNDHFVAHFVQSLARNLKID